MSDGKKIYLGDAVYAKVSEGVLVLTTEDGIRATNTIILEPETLAALLQYITSLNPPAIMKEITKYYGGEGALSK